MVMAVLRCGIDHYSVVSDTGVESVAVYGEPCILADGDTGDVLFAFLDIPDDDGSIRGAMGLGAVVYRLDLPDREEETVVEDLPDGFDFEQEDEYESPFADEEEEESALEADAGDAGDAGDDLDDLDDLDGGDGGDGPETDLAPA